MTTQDLNEVGAHCPVCGSEYRPGFGVCSDDGTRLVAGPAPETGPWNAPAEPKAEPVEPLGIETAVVCALPYEEAYLMAGRLESEGIPARVDPPDYASYYGKMLHPTFDVLVARNRYDEARAIVESILQS